MKARIIYKHETFIGALVIRHVYTTESHDRCVFFIFFILQDVAARSTIIIRRNVMSFEILENSSLHNHTPLYVASRVYSTLLDPIFPQRFYCSKSNYITATTDADLIVSTIPIYKSNAAIAPGSNRGSNRMNGD